jgi:Flp pilus assembly CpaE family ATPase
VVTEKMIRDSLGRELLCVVPNNYKAVSEAIDMGRPLAEDSDVFTAIAAAAATLAGTSAESRKPDTGWLSRLWPVASRR